MIALLVVLLRLLVLPSKVKPQLEAENAALRQHVAILQRKVRGRVRLTNSDRLFFVLLYRWFPSILKTMTIIEPETLVRWHRAGFRRYWRWKSRNLGGRSPISAELRALTRRMSLENTLWGAPHIHGELLKLGFTVAQSQWPSTWPSRAWTPRPELEHVPSQSYACPFRKSYPDVMVVQAGQDRDGDDVSGPLHGAALGARLCPGLCACGPHCNRSHTMKELVEDAPRQKSTSGPGTLCARCQSDAPRRDFAMAPPARSAGPGYP